MSEHSAGNHRMGDTDLRTRTTGQIDLCQLSGESHEMADLQRVLEQAPRYAQLVTGSPPGRADAQSTFTILPDGKSYADKFVFGVYVSSQMIGCIDVIRGCSNRRGCNELAGASLLGESLLSPNWRTKNIQVRTVPLGDHYPVEKP
jgi:hypothetical protein